MLHVNQNITIPTTELRFSFARSPGPGGQNVNKVNSKAVLRWSLTSRSVDPVVKQRIRNRYGNQVNRHDEIVISSHKHRDQPRNVADCLSKLKRMILNCTKAPKVRKKTKPSAGSVRRRLENKRRHSEKKKSRSPQKWD